MAYQLNTDNDGGVDVIASSAILGLWNIININFTFILRKIR